MNRLRLLIDAGNARLKWATVEDGRWREEGATGYDDWSRLQAQLTRNADCFIASVTSPIREQQLARLLEAAGIAPTWLAASAEFAGVTNGYIEPSQLGVDRWMGLIAARKRTPDPVLVVSVGTAMTVDALAADGMFVGGLIVPGVRLMRQALAQGTTCVGDAAGSWQAFPQKTSDAVQSGIVAALCGAIQQQYAHLAAASVTEPRCFVTGGDAETVLAHLAVPAQQIPALVLEGIDCVVRERGSE